MNDVPEPGAVPVVEPLPFGTTEILAAAAGARRVLDAGCGGGRLTVALAQAGAEVTGIDTSGERLEQARRRADGAGVELRLLEADFNAPLPFSDASFDAVTSRLALMAADDAVATLHELRRVLEPRGRLVTVVWCCGPTPKGRHRNRPLPWRPCSAVPLGGGALFLGASVFYHRCVCGRAACTAAEATPA